MQLFPRTKNNISPYNMFSIFCELYKCLFDGLWHQSDDFILTHIYIQNCQRKDFLNILFITGKELPIEKFGSRMTPMADGKGLLMTYEKGVYSFQCTSANDCYWTKKDYELQIYRRSHLFLTVPSSLVEDC